MNVDVAAGSSRKVAAVKAAKKLGATWIVLDRLVILENHDSGLNV